MLTEKKQSPRESVSSGKREDLHLSLRDTNTEEMEERRGDFKRDEEGWLEIEE